MIFAYADPPYVNQAKTLYGKEHDFAGEVDHQELLTRLVRDYDGWALSLSTSSMKYILGLPACPDNVRIAAWAKPWAEPFPGVNPMFTWEPVIFHKHRVRNGAKVLDWVLANPPNNRGLVGVKPFRFNVWILQLLGYEIGDSLDDVFPGTGGMSAAVTAYEEHLRTGSKTITAPVMERAKDFEIPALTKMLGQTKGRSLGATKGPTR